MIYIFQLYLLACCLMLASKDADSYQLKDKKDNDLSAGRVKRWHRDGFILYCLYILPLAVWDTRDNWKIAIAATLIRASVFDLAFNHWADGISPTYLGGTAWADKLFVKIFGINGAVKKSITFFCFWIAANLLNHFL